MRGVGQAYGLVMQPKRPGTRLVGKDPMNRKLFLWAAAVVAAAVAATGAMAAHATHSSTTTIKAVTTAPKVVVNRYIQDGLRWNKDVYKVQSGGKVRIVNMAASEGPHTFTVIVKKDAPRTGAQIVNCRICNQLGKAHGANPASNAPPKYQYLENGVGQNTPPSVDKPGDSGVTGQGKKGESINLTVTAPAGTKLYFICLIHPWMQAELDVT
jgi:uncharacterized cupredoxin-like copper-binding protein